MSTLRDLLNLMPTVMKGRYREEQFWIPTANIILSEIERVSDTTQFYVDDLLLLKPRVSEYKIPDKIRRAKSLRAVPEGDIHTYRLKIGLVDYQLSDRLIRLLNLPILFGFDENFPDEVADINGTIKFIVDNRIYSGDLVEPTTNTNNSLVSWALEIHKDESTIENEFKITTTACPESEFDVSGDITTQTGTPTLSFIATSLIGNTQDFFDFFVEITFADATKENSRVTAFNSTTGEITIAAATTQNITVNDDFALKLGFVQWNGVFNVDPVNALTGALGKAFHITPNYYVINGFKKFVRFTTANIESQEIDLPFGWDSILRDGLRYYGELQTDRKGSLAALAKNSYDDQMDQWVNFWRKPIGDQRNLTPDDQWESLQGRDLQLGIDKRNSRFGDFNDLEL